MSFLGVVLAGGRSLRMGSDKAWLRLATGEPLWKRQERVLREAGAERVIFVRAPDQPAFPRSDCIRDRIINGGPLSGLDAAFAAARASWLAVLAVDMPWIGPQWFRWLRHSCRPGVGAMARTTDHWEPLAAIYPAEAFSEVSLRLQRRDLSLQRLASALAFSGRLTAVRLPAAEAGQILSVNTPSLARTLFKPAAP